MHISTDDLKKSMRRQAQTMRAPDHLRKQIMMIPQRPADEQKFPGLNRAGQKSWRPRESWRTGLWGISASALAASFAIGFFALTSGFSEKISPLDEGIIISQDEKPIDENSLDPSGVFTTDFPID